jgi:hypothetical protein
MGVDRRERHRLQLLNNETVSIRPRFTHVDFRNELSSVAREGADHHETARDAVALRDLLDDVEGEIIEQRRYSAVERLTPSRSWYSSEPTWSAKSSAQHWDASVIYRPARTPADDADLRFGADAPRAANRNDLLCARIYSAQQPQSHLLINAHRRRRRDNPLRQRGRDPRAPPAAHRLDELSAVVKPICDHEATLPVQNVQAILNGLRDQPVDCLDGPTPWTHVQRPELTLGGLDRRARRHRLRVDHDAAGHE